MDMQLMQARVEYIQTVKDSMVDMDVDGNEIKFFSSKFLVQKYLKLSDADLKLNDKLKSEEIEELNLAGGDNGGDDAGDMGFESVAIDYDKLSNMIVEKLSQKANLTEDKDEETPKAKGKATKKKKVVKTKGKDDADEIVNKEEE